MKKNLINTYTPGQSKEEREGVINEVVLPHVDNSNIHFELGDVLGRAFPGERGKILEQEMNEAEASLTDLDEKVDRKVEELSAAAIRDKAELKSDIGNLETQTSEEFTRVSSNLDSIEAKHLEDVTKLTDRINGLDGGFGEDLSELTSKVNGLDSDLGETVIRVSSSKPAAVAGKNVIWIKI